MKCNLSEIMNIIGGGTPKTTKPEYWNGTIPWLSVKDFANSQRYVYTTEKCITEIGLLNSSANLLRKDDTIISARGTVGELAMIPFPMAFNQSCYGLRAKRDVVDPVFLYYLMRYHVGALKKNTHGSVFDTITRDTFSNIEVEIPSLKLQKRIAAILSSLDDKIELNNKINANLERQAQAVFTAWFAEAKPSVSFVSLVRVLGGGTPRTSVAEFWEGEISFFTPKDVYGVYTLETEKSLTDDGLAHCNSCLFPTNTVFVTARGTVGKLTLAGRPMAMNQSCYALLGQEGYGQYFVYHLAQRVITHLKHKANGAVFDAIVTRDFESEFVPDIKPSEAANFELKVKPLYEAILRNYEENYRLSALRDMLLQRLISDDLLPLEFQ